VRSRAPAASRGRAYLDELEWRFSYRNNPYLFRDTLRSLVSADALTYEALTSDG
jgi:hypothetical protein